MGMLLMFAAFLGMGLCLAKDKTDRRRFLGGVGALLCLPIGALVSLIRKCK